MHGMKNFLNLLKILLCCGADGILFIYETAIICGQLYISLNPPWLCSLWQAFATNLKPTKKPQLNLYRGVSVIWGLLDWLISPIRWCDTTDSWD